MADYKTKEKFVFDLAPKLKEEILFELKKVVVGKGELLEKILIAILAEGHILLEGVPGLGKTLIARGFSKVLGCSFKRIQFTSDMLPSDIIGSFIYSSKEGEFKFRQGPIFSNIILADEINRAPPKCLDGETPIHLSTGQVEIRKIYENCKATEKRVGAGEFVKVCRNLKSYSLNQRGFVVKRKIKYLYRQLTLKPVYEVELSAGQVVKCSPRHFFHVYELGRFKWKEASSLRVGDIVSAVMQPLKSKNHPLNLVHVEKIKVKGEGKLKVLFDLSMEDGAESYVCGWNGGVLTHNTQSALLEAMQEKQVTVEGKTFPLPNPFFVVATQNPLEMEGVYTLPEAQIDRFMFKIKVNYPSKKEERDIMKGKGFEAIKNMYSIGSPRILKILQDTVKENIFVDDKVINYISDIVHETRRHELVLLGPSPRASISFVKGSKCRALLNGRSYVVPDDVKYLANPVLRHRIMLKPEAELEGVTVESIISSVLREVEVP